MSEIAEMVSRKDACISAQGRKALNDLLLERSRLYALNLPEFTSLSKQDQVNGMGSFFF
jgi:hypothetical protein